MVIWRRSDRLKEARSWMALNVYRRVLCSVLNLTGMWLSEGVLVMI